MKIDLNESLERLYFTESKQNQIKVDDVFDVEEDGYRSTFTARLYISGDAEKNMVEYINKKFPPEDGELPCTHIKYIDWVISETSEGDKWNYPAVIECECGNGEEWFSIDDNDEAEEVFNASGLEEYDVETAIDEARQYMDF